MAGVGRVRRIPVVEREALPSNWAIEWDSQKSMEFFLIEDDDDVVNLGSGVYGVYVMNKESLKMYHVVDFCSSQQITAGCVYSRGKLYLVGCRSRDDVHVCDLWSKPTPPYVWYSGPPMYSVKPSPHLVAFNGFIFVLSTPPPNYFGPDPFATFEVLDTNLDICYWNTLPDPPFKDFEFYEIASLAVLHAKFYFVFDFFGSYRSVGQRSRISKSVSFDPKLGRWEGDFDDVDDSDDYDDDDDDDDDDYDDEEEKHDMLSLYIDFSAHRHTFGVHVLEFFEDDPSLRMFLVDPMEIPCFYTYDISNFNPKSMIEAVRYFGSISMGHLMSDRFVNWFQEFVRPYLSSVTGLSSLLQEFKWTPIINRACFILPSSYEKDCWTFCIVIFIHREEHLRLLKIHRIISVVAKCCLRMINHSFHAEVIEKRVEILCNTSTRPMFSRIP